MRFVSNLSSSAGASVLPLTAESLALNTKQLGGITGSVTLRVSCPYAAIATSKNAHRARTLLLQEQRPYVPLEQVLGDVAGYRLLTLLQHVQVSGAHLRGHLVTHVQQLPHVRIESRVRLIVA